MYVELSERDKDRDKKERKKGKNPATTEGMRGVEQRKFRSNLGRERVQKKEK
jgi:hypothetical protein